MIELAKIAAKEIEAFKNNPIIKQFVEDEAYAKIASEIDSKPGRCCNAKSAFLIVNNIKNDKIMARWQQYVNLGYMGCLKAKYSM